MASLDELQLQYSPTALAVFAYRAVDLQMRPVQGRVAADSSRAARDDLRARGFAIQSLIPEAEQGSAARTIWRLTPSRHRQLEVIRELSTLLSVGIPLVESLDILLRQHAGRWHTSLLRLRDRVVAGASLSEAMSDQPQYFDSLCRRMTEVGEHSGTLDSVLGQLADFRDRSLQLRDRVTSALLYPVIVLAAAIGVSLFLMTVVVPMLLDNLTETGRPLPWPTRLLKGVSDLLIDGFPMLIAAGVAGLITAAWALRRPSVRRRVDGWLLKTPLIGRLVQQQAVARLSLVLAVLLRSGLEFLDALAIATDSVRNVVLRDALTSSSAAVRNGRDIGAALESTHLFSPLVVQVFAVGQQTGRLDEMLERLATDFDRQSATLTARLATLLEPLLIIAVSVIVGFVLFATILPILEAGHVL